MTESIRIHIRYDLGGPPRIVIATVRDKVESYWFPFIPHTNTTLKHIIFLKTHWEMQGKAQVLWRGSRYTVLDPVSAGGAAKCLYLLSGGIMPFLC